MTIILPMCFQFIATYCPDSNWSSTNQSPPAFGSFSWEWIWVGKSGFDSFLGYEHELVKMVLAVFLWYESQLTAWPSLRYSRAIQASTIQSQSCRKPFFWQLFWFSFLITFEKTHWRKAKHMQHGHPSKRHPKPKLQKNLSFQIFILTIKLRIQQDTACRAIQPNAFQNFSSDNFSDFHPHHPHTAKMSGVGFWPQRSPFWPFWQLLHFYPHQQASDHPYPNTQSFWSSLHCMSSSSSSSW